MNPGMNLETLITSSILLPLLGAVLMPLFRQRRGWCEGLSLLTALLLLGNVSWLLSAVLSGARPEVVWLEIMPGLALHFSVEPLGMLFATIAALLWPINTLYSIGYLRSNHEQHQTRFYTCFALALAATMGLAFSGNLLTMFVFYELLTLVTYPLVIHKGNAAAVEAGRRYLGILVGTSMAFFLPAILWTWHSSGTLTFTPGGIFANLAMVSLPGVLLLLFVFGIGKAALMPVHRWLPAAMVAPTPVSALLHAVAVVKAGVFCILKIMIYVFGMDGLRQQPGTHWLLYAAAFTLIMASIIAMLQDNLKRRLAYSTISQLAYIIFAAAILAPLSTLAAALHIATHAFGKITLFFAAGAIYTQSHKTRVSELQGIGRRMPWTMAAFSIGALSMIGIPPTAGFFSKWYMFLSAFQTEHYFALGVLIVSTLLNAAYFLPILHIAWFRPPADNDCKGEAPGFMLTALLLSALLTLLLLFFPQIPMTLATALSTADPGSIQ